MYEISNLIPQDIRNALSLMTNTEEELESARERLNLRIIDVLFSISRYFQSNPPII